MRLVVTDSGLGGLAICAELARRAEMVRVPGGLRLTYVNAWPEEGRGYNDLPDTEARAAVFDRALARMAALSPECVLIACNTLSILYPLTKFSRTSPVRVDGIIDAGVDLFAEALDTQPGASIVLLGTKTTIESGVHRDRLVERGFDVARIAAVACHGLATAIERDIAGPGVGALIEKCASDVRAASPAGRTILVGLCCTHYGYVADRIAAALAAALERPAIPLDPNRRLVDTAASRLLAPGRDDVGSRGLDTGRAGGAAADAPVGTVGAVSVEVLSKVALDQRSRNGIAQLVAPVSAATARALLGYAHVPDLF